MIGAWLRLARAVLKLPEGNPKVPAGDPASVLVWNPGAGYLGYRLIGWFFGAAFTVAVVIGAAVGAGALRREVDAPWVPGATAAGVVLIAAWGLLGNAWQLACIRLELDMLRYTLTDRAMRLRRGVRDVREVTISYANVQNVRYAQGPIQRAFGIADLVVDVAGGGGAVEHQQQLPAQLHQGRIVGISDPEALRDLILQRVRAIRGAGLGDDHEEGPPSSSLDSEAGRALLVEIRDGLAAASAALRGNRP